METRTWLFEGHTGLKCHCVAKKNPQTPNLTVRGPHRTELSLCRLWWWVEGMNTNTNVCLLCHMTVFITSHDTETEHENNRHKMIERRGNWPRNITYRLHTYVAAPIATAMKCVGGTDKCRVGETIARTNEGVWQTNVGVTDKCGMGQTNAHLSHIFFYMYLSSIIIPRPIQVFKYQLSHSAAESSRLIWLLAAAGFEYEFIL